MSHLEARQEKDLNGIRERMITQADAVAVAVENAVRSVQTNDRRLAYDTVLADHPINRLTREIDKLCHRFIAVHLPSAGPLRLLSSVIRANVELERIGDYAVTVARETAQMSAPPEGIMARELDRVAGETLLMLRQSVKAFKELNAELARGTVGIADQLQLHMDMVYAELRANTDKDKIKDSLAIFVVFTQLKRVADQAKNLCEHTIFAQTGEQKAPKVYRILFVDRDNSRLGPMAQAIAAHACTNSGRCARGRIGRAVDSVSGRPGHRYRGAEARRPGRHHPCGVVRAAGAGLSGVQYAGSDPGPAFSYVDAGVAARTGGRHGNAVSRSGRPHQRFDGTAARPGSGLI